MQELARYLKIEIFAAVGLLESLWHFVGEFTPEGDIGRVSDQAIADAIGWRKPPDQLIEALVETRWLERSCIYRLVVHDWNHHADNTVRKYLSRHKRVFLPIYKDYVQTDDGHVADSVGHTRAGRGSGRGPEEVIKNNPLPPEKLARAEDPAVGPWIRAGFESPEGFQVWFTTLYAEHPTRGAFEVAKTILVGEILDGRLKRDDFEVGYLAHRKSSAWTRDGGRYIPKLSVFCQDQGWKFPPKEPTGLPPPSGPMGRRLNAIEAAKAKSREEEQKRGPVDGSGGN